MKVLVWILGGVLCAAGLPLMLVLEAMAFGGAQAGNNVLDFVFLSMVAIPVVWLVALILCRLEAKRRQRKRLLWVYHLLPFGAWAVHRLILVFTLQWSSGSFRRANDRATAKATEAIKFAPSQPENYFTRGNLRAKVGGYDEAIADFTEAVRLKPDFGGAYYGRGFAYEMKGDPDRAFADYNEAIRLNPNHVDALRQRGFHYRDKEDLDHAIADFTAILRVEPGDRIAEKNLQYLQKRKGH